MRVFYNKSGKRIKNDRAVYKEVFSFDNKGFKSTLKFFNLKENPMNSNWNISEYQWSQHKKMVIEKRFNLKGKAVDISPYFKFGITGIVYNKKGLPKANYNLSDDLNVTENSVGVASYQDQYDENGNHVIYSYHLKEVDSQWGGR